MIEQEATVQHSTHMSTSSFGKDCWTITNNMTTIITKEGKKGKQGAKSKPAQVLFTGTLVLVALLTTGMAWTALHTSKRLQETLQIWQVEAPHTSCLGQLRQVLAGLGWLGPLKPDPPRNPLNICGVYGKITFWNAFWRLKEAKERLQCL